MNNTNDPSNGNGVGTVIRKTPNLFWIQSNGNAFASSLSARLRMEMEAERTSKAKRKPGTDAATPVVLVVGDQVRYRMQGDSGGGMPAGAPNTAAAVITEILPRRNTLRRRSAVPMPSAHAFEQIIAANVDLVVPVIAAASPAPKWNLLDRYLVSAESSGIAALVCITKLDLAAPTNQASSPDEAAGEDLWEAVDEYRRIGYPVILTSASKGQGLDELKQALTGRTSVLFGKSGVGKTTLLNALQPGLGLRVAEVSRIAGKGRHTTTHVELFPLDFGGALVDTPGLREFGLWDVDEDDLALFFPEMIPFVGQCRFGMNCQHDEEPGCAVRKAVAGGLVSPRRYQSYLRMRVDP